MAYWFKAGSNSGSSRQIEFLMDSDADVSSLPTSSQNGTKQQNDDVSHLKCGKGSVALSIGTGNVFILNSNDFWVKIGG